MKYKEAIQKYGLDTRCRKRDNVWRRAIISHELREKGFTTTQLGELFNRDHSSIVHLGKVYTAWSMYRDFKLFQAKFLREMNSATLKEKVLLCETYQDFLTLKESL